jgi:hypothetical protein
MRQTLIAAIFQVLLLLTITEVSQAQIRPQCEPAPLPAMRPAESR